MVAKPATKSAWHWGFIGPLASYLIPYSDSSMKLSSLLAYLEWFEWDGLFAPQPDGFGNKALVFYQQ